ncbi:hypothetical protein A2W48_00190 [Candidatus Giovannonibacteria bacterium RIFCSPHIGHO2_12_44_12]|nr:MAG: hypothetical protein A2W57_03470 [Candidatus Giovannonibacteria bacterium RIFCSPHIGHO2_02_43_16]OGF81784.1 MAG: hypothetical protein A2W48_00190 [Candidatus Giovannonibacteria bacterium RIFCSPHIGHO2_12_44_12]
MECILEPRHSQLFLQTLVGPFKNEEEAGRALIENGFEKTTGRTYFHPKLMVTYFLRQLEALDSFADEIKGMIERGETGRIDRMDPFK